MDNNYSNQYANEGYELSWDSAIENDSPEFVILPDGDYDFVVERFERERFNGSEKLPPCWKAVIYLKITAPQGETTVKKDLFLHSKCEGMLCAFFIAIGQRKHGERINMNWNAVVGARGRVKLGTREYNGKKYNEVKRFLEPAANQTYAAPAGSGYVPGKF